MNAIVAVIFVALAIASAEPQRPSSRQTELDAPYSPSGWKPNGPLLQYPVRNSRLEAYGPPQSIYGPPKDDSENTTTDSATEATTTIEPESENVNASSSPAKLQSEKSETSAAPPNQFYFIVNPPQTQRLVLATPLKVAPAQQRRATSSARLEEFDQAVPAVEQVQPVPVQFEQVQSVPVQFGQIQTVPFQFEQVQAVPLSGYVSQSSILTPYSSSFVQIYQ